MEKFDEFLDSTFTVIKKESLTSLIIDVRRNGGGNSQMGDMLINYITEKPYRQIDRMEVKNSADAPLSSQNKIGTISVVENKSLKKPKNPKNKFTGKTYLLTSHVTFSSANMLADAFKCYQMGIIVGEETGGVLTAFGDIISLKLPNTQLQAGCAFKKFTHPCADATVHGVKPDVEIVPTLEDIQNRRDPAIEYVIKTVKGN
jgi:C-terminal processing protease CtpA/Prc